MYEINWGELDPERFLSQFWQKKPLVIRQAFPNFEPLIEPDELAGLALEAEIESRLIQYNPESHDWSVTKGPLDEDLFSQLPPSHWTLLVQAVDHYIDEAATLLDAFNFIPNWRVDDLMISYATPGGGVGPHYDNYDVFLLQAGGTRRWEIGDIADSKSARIDNVPVLLLREFEARESFVLEPGDLLYLPPQFAHNGIATSEACVTYSIGFRAPSRAELLHSFAESIGEKLSAEDRYADPDLKPTHESGCIDDRALDRVKTLLNELLAEGSAVDQWFGQFITEPKYPDGLYRPDEAETSDWLASLDLTEGVQRAPDARLAYIERESEFKLFCNGDIFLPTTPDFDWIKTLCDSRFSGPLPATPSSREMLSSLYQAGGIN